VPKVTEYFLILAHFRHFSSLLFFLFAAESGIKIGVLKKRLTAESAENAEMKEIKKNTFSAGSANSAVKQTL
jgi:hypothetical protein